MNREQQIDKQIEALREEREQLRARKMLSCECGKRSQISKWILIADHHYIRPHGCTGGDYWTFSKEYHLVCPKCHGMGRVSKPYHWDEKEDEEDNSPKMNLYRFVHEHRYYFGEQLDAYGDNYTVESLRKKKKEQEDRKWIY